MTRTFKRIIAVGILFIAIAALAVALVVMSANRPASAGAFNPLEDLKNGAFNTAMDITGVKGRIDSELRERTGALASQLGVSQSMAEGIVDELAIPDWRAAALPADVKETSTSTLSIRDINATITTYDDPGYVTVEAYGVPITLAVPESARTYTPLLEVMPLVTKGAS